MQDDLATHGDRCQRHLDRHVGAVGAPVQPLEAMNAGLERGRDHRLGFFLRRLAIRLTGRRDICRAHVQELRLVLITQQLQRGRIAVDEAAVLEQQDRILHVLEQAAESFLALVEQGVCFLAGSDVFLNGQKVRDFTPVIDDG